MFGGVHKTNVVGLPWFRREDWPALRKLFVDADKLHPKWEGWHGAAMTIEHGLRQDGHHVVRAEIRPRPFAAWCRALGIPRDAQARTRWANDAAEREARQQSKPALYA